MVASVEGPSSAYKRLGQKSAETAVAARRLLNNTLVQAVASNRRSKKGKEEWQQHQHGPEHRE